MRPTTRPAPLCAGLALAWIALAPGPASSTTLTPLSDGRRVFSTDTGIAVGNVELLPAAPFADFDAAIDLLGDGSELNSQRSVIRPSGIRGTLGTTTNGGLGVRHDHDLLVTFSVGESTPFFFETDVGRFGDVLVSLTTLGGGAGISVASQTIECGVPLAPCPPGGDGEFQVLINPLVDPLTSIGVFNDCCSPGRATVTGTLAAGSYELLVDGFRESSIGPGAATPVTVNFLVPEPATGVLLGLGLAALRAPGRRRRAARTG